MKQIILTHIKENAKSKGIYIDFLNGHKEHFHCIVSLDAEQTLAKTMQLIKGESSFWINKNNYAQGNFEWADEYFAVSVSESQIDNVREYIKNQEIHHKRKSWEDEYNEFIEKYEAENKKKTVEKNKGLELFIEDVSEVVHILEDEETNE